MRKIIRTFALLLLGLGFAIFICPMVFESEFRDQVRGDIADIDAVRNNIGSESKSSGDTSLGAGKSIDYEALRRDMIRYNNDLYANKQSGIIDQMSFEDPDFKLSNYGLKEIFGYITIPVIDVDLPIYNGTSESNMAMGAVLLSHTSLPIGGNNTNSVIAAHHRYAGIPMFKRIVELQIGDLIYVTNFWDKLTYKVVETKIIDPSDSKNIYIQDGRNLITLSTCHPFPYTYQRYLVYAEFCG